MNTTKKYKIEVEMEFRELVSLLTLEQNHNCMYNADLNRYEMGVAALVSKVVRGKCEGYESFVKDYDKSYKEITGDDRPRSNPAHDSTEQ